ncbi:response regulator [bacterium]|nr:response regulator [bacterium]
MTRTPVSAPIRFLPAASGNSTGSTCCVRLGQVADLDRSADGDRALPLPASPGLHILNRLRFAAALLVAGVCAIGIGILAVEVTRQIDRARSSGSDNVQWALDQADMELLHLDLAVRDAMAAPDDLSLLRKRYDVLFSRVRTLAFGEVFAKMRATPAFADGLAEMQDFLVHAAPLIDGGDKVLQDALPDLDTRLRALIPITHRMALAGVSIFASQSDAARETFGQTLIKLAALTLALVAVLAGMLIMVLRLERRNRQRTAENVEMLARLDAVVSSSLDCVITLDDRGRIVDFNPAASRTFGYPRQDVVGHYLSLLVPPDAKGKAQLPALNAPLAKGRRRLRISARRRDGVDFPAEMSLSTAKAGPKPVHVVFLRDLSQQVAAEQALVKARDEALVGEKAKADLLVVMSHEIRTPLNGMIGTIELLDGTELAPHQREYLRIMAASGRLLMHHVNDVLDIARLDSGKSPLTLAPLDLAELVGEVIENQSPASLANGNRLILVPPPDGRTKVMGDAVQVRQVLMNLVGNAVKFTRNGKITIEISHPSGRNWTDLTVRDTGIGIAQEDLTRIFEDFVTLDPSYARHASGTGLGLGIVRRIVTRMGGKIRVESETGKGSTFRVTLPLAVVEEGWETPAAIAAPQALPDRLSILVVEDNDFNRLIVRDILIKDGHAVTEAANGEEGIARAEVQAFDVILMDISMPGIDGLRTAEHIRQGNGLSKGAPIVALTAHALQEEADRFRNGGMSDVLIKPITREALRAVLARLRPPPVQEVPAETLLDAEVLDQLRQSLGEVRANQVTLRFLAETGARMAALQANVATPGAEPSIVADIHRMAGTAAMFGAVAFRNELALIETLCKQGDHAAARRRVDTLVPLWQQTSEAFHAMGYREAEALPQASSLR